eukprot:4840275-Pleurochrysis_carterae.AAC.6
MLRCSYAPARIRLPTLTLHQGWAATSERICSCMLAPFTGPACMLLLRLALAFIFNFPADHASLLALETDSLAHPSRISIGRTHYYRPIAPSFHQIVEFVFVSSCAAGFIPTCLSWSLGPGRLSSGCLPPKLVPTLFAFLRSILFTGH